jgi:hypothetical protein
MSTALGVIPIDFNVPTELPHEPARFQSLIPMPPFFILSRGKDLRFISDDAPGAIIRAVSLGST